MAEHHDDCVCTACEAEAAELRALLLGALDAGTITETALLDACVAATERPEMVAMVEDYRIRQEETDG